MPRKAIPEMVTIEILKNNSWEVVYSEIDNAEDGELTLFDKANETVREAILTGKFTHETVRAARSPFGLRMTGAQKKELYGDEGPDDED